MRHLLFLFFVFLSCSAFAEKNKKLEAFFTSSLFYSPASGPYLEAYLTVNASSVVYKKNNSGKYQSNIEVTYIFYQGETIKKFEKFELLGPEIGDTLTSLIDFIDQKRIPLDPGDYDMEIIIKDLNNVEPFIGVLSISVSENKKARFSEVLLTKKIGKSTSDGFEKSGIYLTPYMSDFFPNTMKRFSFYAELYNMEEKLGVQQDYLLRYYLKDQGGTFGLEAYTKVKRKKTKKVEVILDQFDISKLKTGQYYLVLEAYDRNNQLITKNEIGFYRENNPISEPMEIALIGGSFKQDYPGFNSIDSLRLYTRALWPVSDFHQKKFIDQHYKSSDLDALQQFFIAFWNGKSKTNPVGASLKYKEQVDLVLENFSIPGKLGFDTDRGVIYLKYGAPNTRVVRENEPSSYPYEIWHYYKTAKRGDAKFVFYNTNIGIQDYRLLHSNVPGEIQNYRWKMELMERNTIDSSVDDDNSDIHWGGQAEELFNNPR